jgi:nitrogen fixation protein NifU and related proteins
MDDLYRELILDHYQHPHNHGEIADADISYEDTNPLCGDKIRIDIKLKNNIVEKVMFNGKGCAISQASASMLTDELIGKSLDDIKKLDKQFILDLLGIPLGPSRIKCALLPLKVIKAGAYGITTWPGDEEEDS